MKSDASVWRPSCMRTSNVKEYLSDNVVPAENPPPFLGFPPGAQHGFGRVGILVAADAQ